jgi:hypothetical protein
VKHLDADAVAHFNHAGFWSPISIIQEQEAAGYRASLEAYESELGHPVQGSLRNKTHLLFKWADNLMRNKTILDCIEDLIGPDILCWNTTFWIKEANTSTYVSWHQDIQYWGLETDKLVTAWLALSPASEESGCMRVMPGTHRGELLPHEDLYHDDNMLTRGQEISAGIDENLAVSMPLEVGEISLHNVRIAHSSQANHSSDRRIGLSFHYMPTSARQLKSEWDCAALVRGKDRFGHFEHTPIPRRDFDPVAVAYHEKATTAMRELLFQGAAKVRPTI